MRVSKAVNTRWGVKDATVSDRSAASSITQESVPEMGRKEGSEEKGKPESSKDCARQNRSESTHKTRPGGVTSDHCKADAALLWSMHDVEFGIVPLI